MEGLHLSSKLAKSYEFYVQGRGFGSGGEGPSPGSTPGLDALVHQRPGLVGGVAGFGGVSPAGFPVVHGGGGLDGGGSAAAVLVVDEEGGDDQLAGGTGGGAKAVPLHGAGPVFGGLVVDVGGFEFEPLADASFAQLLGSGVMGLGLAGAHQGIGPCHGHGGFDGGHRLSLPAGGELGLGGDRPGGLGGLRRGGMVAIGMVAIGIFGSGGVAAFGVGGCGPPSVRGPYPR